jgi:hypothetical protein
MLGMVVCTCNCNTQEAEAGGLQVRGQPELHSEFQASLDLEPYQESVSKKKKKRKPKKYLPICLSVCLSI